MKLVSGDNCVVFVIIGLFAYIHLEIESSKQFLHFCASKPVYGGPGHLNILTKPVGGLKNKKNLKLKNRMNMIEIDMNNGAQSCFG